MQARETNLSFSEREKPPKHRGQVNEVVNPSEPSEKLRKSDVSEARSRQNLSGGEKRRKRRDKKNQAFVIGAFDANRRKREKRIRDDLVFHTLGGKSEENNRRLDKKYHTQNARKAQLVRTANDLKKRKKTKKAELPRTDPTRRRAQRKQVAEGRT